MILNEFEAMRNLANRLIIFTYYAESELLRSTGQYAYILICQTFLLCTKIMFTQLMPLARSTDSHTFYTGTRCISSDEVHLLISISRFKKLSETRLTHPDVSYTIFISD